MRLDRTPGGGCGSAYDAELRNPRYLEVKLGSFTMATIGSNRRFNFESKGPSFPSVAFLWPALAAEQASEFAAAIAKSSRSSPEVRSLF
jgi:hypothetical protein